MKELFTKKNQFMSLPSQDFQGAEILNHKTKIWRLIIDVIILFLISGVFFYLGSLKDIWFCDEVWTYESANQESVSLYEVFPFDEWVSGKESL